MFFFLGSSITQIAHVSQRFRDASSFVCIFPRRRGNFWTSLRDSSVAIGASSQRSFGLYIHHRVPRAGFHLMQRKSMIERSGTSLQVIRQMVARPRDLSYMPLQSLGHHRVYATCVESGFMILLTVERQSSSCSWG